MQGHHHYYLVINVMMLRALVQQSCVELFIQYAFSIIIIININNMLVATLNKNFNHSDNLCDKIII